VGEQPSYEEVDVSAYRTSQRPVGYENELAYSDPFPCVKCRTCGRKTTSVSGEEDCATCDLEWLMKGVDWQDPTRLLLGRTAFYGVQ
jgi:hypothetical protein